MVWRYLPHNKSSEGPGQIVFVDTETLPHPIDDVGEAKLHKLRLGVAISGRLEKGEWTRRKICHFTDYLEFWSFIETLLHKRIPTWIFAHNVGFDLTILKFWELLEESMYVLTTKDDPDEATQKSGERKKRLNSLLILDDPPTLITAIRPGHGTIKIMDTLNWWRTSLAKLGESTDLPKMEMPPFEANDKTWFQYCQRDVEVLEKVVLHLIRWVKENDLGKFRFTQASQAMGSFRHRFMKHKILFHDVAEVKKLERRSYYGGHLECFYIGEIITKGSERTGTPRVIGGRAKTYIDGPLYQLDITSMYPSVMRTKLFPWKLVSWEITQSESKPNWHAGSESGIADCLIETSEDTFPYRSDDMTYYPLGIYRTTLAGPELARAYKAGAILATYSWATYRLTDLFSDYVNFFWSERAKYKREGNKLYDGLCKLMLNSLYGKFGQKTHAWHFRPSISPPKPWHKWYEFDKNAGRTTEFRSIGWSTQIRVAREEHPMAFPAIASFVTSYGRELIRNYRNIAGEENVYYQAVDSLYVNKIGYNNLLRSSVLGKSELGMLNCESENDYGEFRSLNNYTLGTKEIRGCIKSRAVKQDDGTWKQTKFQHLASVLSSELKGGIIVEDVIKRLQEKYRRGNIDADGRVTPLILNCPAGD